MYYGGSIPFIRSGEISSDKTELFLTKNGLENSSAKMVKKGDLLLAMYGATSGEVSISKINGAINQAILAIKPYNDYNSIFIMYWLQKEKRKITDTYLQGGQGNLSASIIKNLLISYPSKEEQDYICNFLSILDNKIAKQQQLVELLKKYRKGIMHAHFTSISLDPHSKKIKLSDDCIFFSGGTPKSSNRKLYEGNISFIRSGEIHKEKTELFISHLALNESSSKMVKKGDLLLAMYGATSGEVSISKINGAINQAILCIRLKTIDTNYLKLVLEFYKDGITSTYMQGGQGNLSAEIIKNLIFKFPNCDIQKEFVSFANKIEYKINLVNTVLEKLQGLKKGLLQQLFI